MAKKRLRTKDVIEAIRKARGNLTAVAKACGVTRQTIHNYVNEFPTVAAALDEAREMMLDAAESVLYKKVLAGSSIDLHFFLKTQGYKRGYGQRQQLEHSGPDGGPIETKEVTPDFSKLTDDELRQYISLGRKLKSG